MKWQILHLKKPQNWFHVKSKGQKYTEISILCFTNSKSYISESEPDQIVEKSQDSEAEDRIQQIDGGVTDATDQEKENEDLEEMLPLKMAKKAKNPNNSNSRKKSSSNQFEIFSDPEDPNSEELPKLKIVRKKTENAEKSAENTGGRPKRTRKMTKKFYQESSSGEEFDFADIYEDDDIVEKKPVKPKRTRKSMTKVQKE